MRLLEGHSVPLLRDTRMRSARELDSPPCSGSISRCRYYSFVAIDRVQGGWSGEPFAGGYLQKRAMRGLSSNAPDAFLWDVG